MGWRKVLLTSHSATVPSLMRIASSVAAAGLHDSASTATWSMFCSEATSALAELWAFRS